MPTDISYLPKHYIQASYFRVVENGVICTLCPHACRLKEGEAGICRARKNIGNKLYALNYGKLCALHIDPIEKKPLYHFLPGTKTLSIASAGCNLRCMNCQNDSISQVSPDEVGNIILTPREVVELAVKEGCPSVSYTYTDPVVSFEYVLDTMRLAHEKGLKNIFVSAGYINPKPLLECCKYIDAANIDLKSFNDETYRKLNGATLKPVLKTLKILKDEGVWLEITNLLIPGYTDVQKEMKDLFRWLADNGFDEVPIHLSRFFPQYRLPNQKSTPIKTLIENYHLAQHYGMKYVYIGNVDGNEYSSTRCWKCKMVMVVRDGYSTKINNGFVGNCLSCSVLIPGRWR